MLCYRIGAEVTGAEGAADRRRRQERDCALQAKPEGAPSQKQPIGLGTGIARRRAP